MRIGIDAHILGKGKGGVERVIHHMVRLLPACLPDSEFVVFINRHYRPTFTPRANVRYRSLLLSDPVLQRSFILPWLARRERLDLLHVQRAAPPCVRARLIVHTHDLLPLTAPADHRGWRDQLVRRLTPASLRRADHILTVSESVAAEIGRMFPWSAGKTTAIYNGVDRDFFRPKKDGAPRGATHARFGLSGPYVLYLGALVERKNLSVAIRGFSQLLRGCEARGDHNPIKLVMAGMSRSDAYVAEIRALADELAPGRVCFTGFIDDSECLELLQQADAFLAPSRGEGFDLPALEAMACAVPVICSELPVHRELLGDDALYFETGSPDSLADGLHRLVGDSALATRLRAAGLSRASRYTWENAMTRLAGVYQKMIRPADTTR